MYDLKLYKGLKEKGATTLKRESDDCVCFCTNAFDATTGVKIEDVHHKISLDSLKTQIEWFEKELAVYKEVVAEIEALAVPAKEVAAEPTTEEVSEVPEVI